MMRHIDIADDVFRQAEALVKAGRFASVEDVIRAGLDALDQDVDVEREWLDHARQRFADGRAAFARGEVTETSPDELMDLIEKDLGLA